MAGDVYFAASAPPRVYTTVIVLPVPTFASSYVATAETVTVSTGATPVNAPAVTVDVVVPSYVFDFVNVGAAIVNVVMLFSPYEL